MPEFSLKDLGGSSASLPNGSVNIQIIKVAAGNPGPSGFPQLTFRGIVTAGDFKGTKVMYWRTTHPDGIWKLADDLRAAGTSETQKFSDPVNDTDNFAHGVNAILAGRIFDIYVQNKTERTGEYAGKTKTEYSIRSEIRDVDSDSSIPF